MHRSTTATQLTENKVRLLLTAAERLSPELYKLPGVVTVGVLNDSMLVVRLRHVEKHPEVLDIAIKALEETGHPYKIQDVTKIDNAKILRQG